MTIRDPPVRPGEWELVGRANITTGVSYYDFLNLRGNQDREYKLEGEIFHTMSGGRRITSLLFNGSNNGYGIHMYKDTINFVFEDTSDFRLWSGVPNGSDSQCSFVAKIWVKGGQYRPGICHYSAMSSDGQLMIGRHGGGWQNLNTEVTSLRISPSGGTFTGRLFLYRRRM